MQEAGHQLKRARLGDADNDSDANDDGLPRSRVVRRAVSLIANADDATRDRWQRKADEWQGLKEGTTVAVSDREKKVFAVEALKRFKQSLVMMGQAGASVSGICVDVAGITQVISDQKETN